MRFRLAAQIEQSPAKTAFSWLKLVTSTQHQIRISLEVNQFERLTHNGSGVAIAAQLVCLLVEGTSKDQVIVIVAHYPCFVVAFYELRNGHITSVRTGRRRRLSRLNGI